MLTSDDPEAVRRAVRRASKNLSRAAGYAAIQGGHTLAEDLNDVAAECRRIERSLVSGRLPHSASPRRCA